MSFGTIGYRDGQRVENWDNAQLDATINGTFTTPQSTPALSVSRYGYVYIQSGVTAGSGVAEAAWYADAALTNQVGYREIVLDSNINLAAQLIFPHIGPWFQATLALMTGFASITGKLNVFLSNRSAAPMGAQVGGTLTFPSGTVLAGATNTYYFGKYYGGPAGVYIVGGTQGVTVTFNFRNKATGNWTPLYSETVAANATDYKIVVIPNDAIQMTVANVSGAVNCIGFAVAVMASFTGSG